MLCNGQRARARGFHVSPRVSKAPASPMSKYRFTDYFEKQVLRKRPYLKKEWCTRVLENPLRSEPQEHNRYRF